MFQKFSVPFYLKITLLLILIFTLGLFLFLVKSPKNLTSKAEESSTLEIRSQNGDALPLSGNIPQSDSNNVKVKITYNPPVIIAPSPTPHATSDDFSQSLYQMKVFVIKYFPLTSNRQNIDITYTGDIGDSYQVIRQKTENTDQALLNLIPKATKYKGYSNSSAEPSLSYEIVGTEVHETFVPFDQSTRKPLYNQILTDHNICDLVNNQGVSEVWLWAYQGGVYPNSNPAVPYLGISESKMSGPHGDISNSFRENDMPQCGKTYRVYTFNYSRGTAEALHSWGHQMESEIDAVDQGQVFRPKFQGLTAHPQASGDEGRCGSVHNPPNARFEYDYNNTLPTLSDCLDWNPDGNGQKQNISCQNWGCDDLGDLNNPQLNYMIWNWQNLPGKGNQVTYQGRSFRNFWDIHGNFDNVMSLNRTIFNN